MGFLRNQYFANDGYRQQKIIIKELPTLYIALLEIFIQSLDEINVQVLSKITHITIFIYIYVCVCVCVCVCG